MKRNREGIELDRNISVPYSQGTNRLPRTRSEVKAAANKWLLRLRSKVKVANKTLLHKRSKDKIANKTLLRTHSKVKVANKTLLRARSQIKAGTQTERYMETQAETSKSAELPDYYCDICMESKTESDMFQNKNGCRHLFCSDCIGKHVESKIKENMTTVICPSPRCRTEIVPKVCQTVVSKEILTQWKQALYELKKFKCPYKDCSQMLVENNKKEPGTSSKCPRCKQLYCPYCKAVWHSEMDCKEFQRLRIGEREPDDLLLMKLAKRNSWQRCPNCMFYIERYQGCSQIVCRCGCFFCYKCGNKYSSPTHECS